MTDLIQVDARSTKLLISGNHWQLSNLTLGSIHLSTQQDYSAEGDFGWVERRSIEAPPAPSLV